VHWSDTSEPSDYSTDSIIFANLNFLISNKTLTIAYRRRENVNKEIRVEMPGSNYEEIEEDIFVCFVKFFTFDQKGGALALNENVGAR
jgi:hypothetical protein